MKKQLLLAALALSATAAHSSAGYIATTTTDEVLTPSTGGPAIGDAFTTATSGGFTTFIGTTPADPTITGNDLNFYRYTLNGAIASIDNTTGQIDYTGTYSIFYDLNLDGTEESTEPTVSTGNFNILATFAPGTNDAALAGTLTQTAGPSNPVFHDLSYGGNPVDYIGTYDGTDPGVSGTITGSLIQTAPIPEPASLGLLAVAGLSFSARRRRTN